MEWEVGEVRETEEGFNANCIKYGVGVTIYPSELALLEHAGFIEEVNEAQTETPKRWRAEKFSKYFFLNDNFEVREEKEVHSLFDNYLYEAGNYFQTVEQIEEFQKGVKALLGIN